MPNLMASVWAETEMGAAAIAVAAAAPLIRARRVVAVMTNPLADRPKRLGRENTRPMSGPEKEPSDFRVGGERTGGTGAAVLAVDQNVGTLGDGQRFVGILLHDRHGSAMLVDFDNGIEQT